MVNARQRIMVYPLDSVSSKSFETCTEIFCVTFLSIQIYSHGKLCGFNRVRALLQRSRTSKARIDVLS